MARIFISHALSAAALSLGIFWASSAFAEREVTVGNPALQKAYTRYCGFHHSSREKDFPKARPECRGRQLEFAKWHDHMAVGLQGLLPEIKPDCKENLKQVNRFNDELINLKRRSEKGIGQQTAKAAANAKDQGGSFAGLADVHDQHADGLNSWNKEILALRGKYAETSRKILAHRKRMKKLEEAYRRNSPAVCSFEFARVRESVRKLYAESERMANLLDLIDARAKTQTEKNRASIAESRQAETRALAKAKDLNEISPDKDAPKTKEEWEEFDRKNGYAAPTGTVYQNKEVQNQLRDYYSNDPKFSQFFNGSEQDRMALQRALKAANPSLVVDGQLGRRTLDSLTNALSNPAQKDTFYRSLREQGYQVDTTIKR